MTRSGATNTASTPPASAPRKIAVNGGILKTASGHDDDERQEQPQRNAKVLRIASSFSLASNSPGRPSIQNTREGDHERERRGQDRLAEVLVQVDARGRGGEIGGIRQRRSRVAEIGARDDRARRDLGLSPMSARCP